MAPIAKQLLLQPRRIIKITNYEIMPFCHSRESGNPAIKSNFITDWIPAFAGMTALFLLFLFFFSFGLFQTAQALTLGPALIEAEAEPGESLWQKIKLFNETNQTLTIYPSLENFQPSKDNKQPEFLGDNDPAGAARWIKVPINQIKLKSGEAKEVMLKIQIPSLAEPGGHYVALFWSEQSMKNVGIGTVSRQAILFFFKIKGEIKEEAKIIFFTRKADSRPLEFSLRLENSGNIHLKPVGKLGVTNWWGQKKGEILFNPLAQAILPQSQRQFDLSWPGAKASWLPYFVSGKILYGSVAKELKISLTKFWLLPENWTWKIGRMAFVIILILLALKIVKRKVGKNKI